MEILKGLLSLATGGATSAGGVTARVASFVALLAALTGPLAWAWAHGGELRALWDATVVSFTFGQCVVGCAASGGFVYLVTLLAHRAPPP